MRGAGEADLTPFHEGGPVGEGGGVIEGLLDDLVHFRFPHILREMGVRAEWEHNRAGFFRKLFYAVGVVALIVLVVAAIATDGFEDLR